MFQSLWFMKEETLYWWLCVCFYLHQISIQLKKSAPMPVCLSIHQNVNLHQGHTFPLRSASNCLCRYRRYRWKDNKNTHSRSYVNRWRGTQTWTVTIQFSVLNGTWGPLCCQCLLPETLWRTSMRPQGINFNSLTGRYMAPLALNQSQGKGFQWISWKVSCVKSNLFWPFFSGGYVGFGILAHHPGFCHRECDGHLDHSGS